MAECDAVSEICDVKGLMRKKRITRMLQLQATVKRFLFDLHLDLEGQHTFTSLWFQRQVT